MEYYLLVARSVTHAQQMMKVLAQAGIHARARRAGHALTGRGCGYTLEVAKAKYETAMQYLRRAQQLPLKVFFVSGGATTEVGV